MGGSSSGDIIGMLEVIASDFARLSSDTKAAETQAEMEYKSYMEDAEADKKAHHDDAFEKKLLKDKKEHENHMVKKDLSEVEKELDGALKYFEELKPSCIQQKVSFEER